FTVDLFFSLLSHVCPHFLLFSLFFFLILRRPPLSTLFPYTTLFRSVSFRIVSYLTMFIFSVTSSVVISGGLVTFTVAVSVWLPSDRKSTRLNSSHVSISYAVFCLKKKRDDVAE